MAYITLTNKFDPSITMEYDDEKHYDYGTTANFTDNKMIAVIKKKIGELVPDASYKVTTEMETWSNLFSYKMDFKVFRKNVNNIETGFTVKLEYSIGQREKYKLWFEAPVPKRDGWKETMLPNKARAFIKFANPTLSSNQRMAFYDPKEDTIMGFIDAMITPNRREALKKYIETDKKDLMESANTKNLLDIETMDIIPELEAVCSKCWMGMPSIEDEAYCRKAILIQSEWGASFKLMMYKEYMKFELTRGADYVSDKFDTNFLRMLKGFLDKSNIDINTHIPYDKKELVYDMLQRIGTIYQKTWSAMHYEAWGKIATEWKRNPNRE